MQQGNKGGGGSYQGAKGEERNSRKKRKGGKGESVRGQERRGESRPTIEEV